MSKRENPNTIDELLISNEIPNAKTETLVEDVKHNNTKLNKPDYQSGKYKVLLVKRDGVVVDFNGIGIFIKTDQKLSVGTYLSLKYKGTLGKPTFELI